MLDAPWLQVPRTHGTQCRNGRPLYSAPGVTIVPLKRTEDQFQVVEAIELVGSGPMN